MFGERIVQGVVFEGKMLVEGRDFVDDSEGYHENTMALLVGLAKRSCDRKGRPCSMMR
jgi:hypothetical protein